MQSLNFEFLREDWPELASLAGFAELYAHFDPQSAQTKLRTYAEGIVGVLYMNLDLLRPESAKFLDLLTDPVFERAVPRVVCDKLHALRMHGNKAAHGDKVTVTDSLWLLKEGFDLGKWLVEIYAKGPTKVAEIFQPPEPPRSAKSQYKKERRALLEKYAKQEAQMEGLLLELKSERERSSELQRIQRPARAISLAQSLPIQDDAIQKAAEKGQKVADELQFSEEEARKYLIDTQLNQAGWVVEDKTQVTTEYPVLHQPTPSGEGKIDYVLWDSDSKPLAVIAVIEAKETATSAENGRQQAKLYADGLEEMTKQRPIIFYTNGHEINIWDDFESRGYPPRKIYGFYSKSSLQYLMWQRAERKRLDTVSPKSEILNVRLYQHEALKRVCESFEAGKRKALVVQATGTGKTRLAVAISDVLFKAGWAKRILFLCDRKELLRQAKNTFSQWLDVPVAVITSQALKEGNPNDQISLATYPTMLKNYERFDPGFFDLIVADESHRSIYNIYGELFKYFDGLQIGLTATPVEMISRSTCQLFGRDVNDPTANYTLEEAVAEGYLVPFKVVKHTTKFLREGIKGKALTPEQINKLQEEGIDPNTIDFNSKDMDQTIYNKDTNRKILKNLMENGIRQADGQTLGKTIIFARNHKHAVLLNQLFEELYPQYRGEFCRVIDHYDPRAEDLIDDLKSNASELVIALSVDMLDTGIDIPEIVNLVFARPVKSPIKFWQMVGRGTRLCPGLFGPGKDKTEFQVFDHWGVVEYHGVQARPVQVTQSKSLMERLFEAQILLAETAFKQVEPENFERLVEWLHKTIVSLPDETIAVRDKWKIKKQMSDRATIQHFSTETVRLMKLEIAPLMWCVDIRNHSDAYQWDLLLSKIQREKLLGSAEFENLIAEAVDELYKLRMNLNQVKAKDQFIKGCRELNWWREASFMDIELVREELRGIMKHRGKQSADPLEAPVIDIEDSEEHSEQQVTHLRGIDMQVYRSKVVEILEGIFESNPIVKKIREGQSLSRKELDQLNAFIHTKNADVDLTTLKRFYETGAPLEQILRSIIGMDPYTVNEKFAKFLNDYPSLDSRQVQFLIMLKRQIGKYGAIEIDSLYEMPFAAVGELDSLFNNEKQIDELISVVKSFGHTPAQIQEKN